MKRWWRIYRSLFSISIKEYIRDPIPTIFTFVMPLSFLFIFGTTFMIAGSRSSAPPAFEIGVFSTSQSKNAERVEKYLDGFAAYHAVPIEVSEAQYLLSRKQLVIAVDVEPTASNSNLIYYGEGMEALAEIVREQSNYVLEESQISEGPALKACAINKLIRVSGATETSNGYITFLMPALIVLALVQLCLYGTASPLISARARGAMRHYSVMPMPRSALLAAQITVRMIIAIIQVSIMLALSVLIFGLEIVGNPVVILAICVIGAATLVSVGYALSGFISSASLGTAVVTMLNFYILVFGQIFVDLRDFAFAKYFLFTTPVASLTDSIREAINGTPGMLPIWANLLILLGWWVAASLLVLKTFSFKPKGA